MPDDRGTEEKPSGRSLGVQRIKELIPSGSSKVSPWQTYQPKYSCHDEEGFTSDASRYSKSHRQIMRIHPKN